MRRVVVTGLGAVTPLGLDAPSTWEAAVAGRSGVDWIRGVRRDRVPRADRGGGEGVRRRRPSSAAEGGAAASSATSLLAVAAAQEAWADAGLDGRRPGAGRDPRRLGDRRHHDDRRAARRASRARPRPRLAVLPPERARRLGERADRDRARAPRAELRARLRLRDGLARRSARARRRSAAATPTSSSPAAPRRRMHPAHPRRLLRDARARRRGGGPDARLAAVRRDARRIRDGRGRLRARARGARGGAARAGRAIYAEVLGYGTSNDAHHMAQPDPESIGVAEMMRAALDARRGRARARRVHQRARHVDAARRPRRDECDQGRSSATTRTELAVSSTKSVTGHCFGAAGAVEAMMCVLRAARGRAPADDQLPEPGSGVRPRLRPERGASRARSTWRSRTRWASAGTTRASCSAAPTEDRADSARRSLVPRTSEARHPDGSPLDRCAIADRMEGVAVDPGTLADTRAPAVPGATACRHCGAPLALTVVDLGMSPLCESFLPPERLERDGALLSAARRASASSCLLVQLPEFVAPEEIFTEYAYFSSYSDSLGRARAPLRRAMIERLGLGPDEPRRRARQSTTATCSSTSCRTGIPVLGDRAGARTSPRRRASAACRRSSSSSARELGRAARRARASAPTSSLGNNVLAQVPDLNDFVAGVAALLAPDGDGDVRVPAPARG